MKSRTPSHHPAAGPARASNATNTGLVVTPSHDDLAKLAYLIYLNQGAVHGRDVTHWLEAEAQMAVPAHQKMEV